jgi:hypothetical protein
LVSGNPLTHQEINVSIFNINHIIINSTLEVTNSTGDVTWVWIPSYFGEFYVILFYPGNGTTYGSAQNTTPTISVWARNVTILEFGISSQEFNLSEPSATGVYQVIDTLTTLGIGNLSFQIKVGGYWCPVQMSNATGFIHYDFIFPQNNMSLLGANLTLTAQAKDLQIFPVYGSIQNNSTVKTLNGSYSVKVNAKVNLAYLEGTETSPGLFFSLFVNITTDYDFPLLFDVDIQLIWDQFLLSEELLPSGVGNVSFQIPNNCTPNLYNLTIRVLSSNRIHSSGNQINVTVKDITHFEWVGTLTPYYFQFIFLEFQLTDAAEFPLGFEWVTIQEIVENSTLAISYQQLNATGFLIYTTQGDCNKTIRITFSGNSNYTNAMLDLVVIPRKIPIQSVFLTQSDIILGNNSIVIFHVEDLFGNQVENYSVGLIVDQIFITNSSSNALGIIEIDLTSITNLPLGPATLEIRGYEGNYHTTYSNEIDVYIKQQVEILLHDWNQNSNEITLTLSLPVTPQFPINVLIREGLSEIGTWLVNTQNFSLTITLAPGTHSLLLVPLTNLPYVGMNLTYEITSKPASYLQVETPQIFTPNQSHLLLLSLTDDNGFSIVFGNITLSIFDSNDSLVFQTNSEVTANHIWPQTSPGEYTLRVSYQDPLRYFSNTTVELQIEVRFIHTQIQFSIEQHFRILTINGVLLDEQNQTLSNATIHIYQGNLHLGDIQTSSSGGFLFEYILTTANVNLTLSFTGEGERNATRTMFQILGVPPSNFSDLEITRVFGVGIFLLSCVSSVISTRKWPRKLEKIKVR